jgi:tetratricopeptide (TPR) repeat protein
MGRHLLLAVFLCFLFSPVVQCADRKNHTVFPLCASNGFNQSERLNQFHVFLATISQKMQLGGIVSVPENSQISNCESSMRRSIAALYNLQGFVQGEYQIIGDTVTISMQYVNTLFVDKIQGLNKVEGNIHAFNEVILKLTMATLQALSVPADTQQIALITEWISEDEKNYTTATAIANSNSGVLELGKLAYALGNYERSMELLLPITVTDNAYAEAQFILGKCVLVINDYHKALIYFNAAKKAGLNEPVLDDYIYQAKRLNKPAGWFDTEKKRKDWWLSLTESEVVLVIDLMNNLKINQGKFKTDYQYFDADIKQLFSTEVLPIHDCKLVDLVLFKHFTKTTFIRFDNCKLETGSGIEYFNHLKIIESDKVAVQKLPALADFVQQNAVTILTK